MPVQRFTIKLTQLRCILESDPGPSEPYLWVTYFALGPQVPPFQDGPLACHTPSYDAFRTEFPSMSAGDVVGIPPFIASANFDMDLDTVGPKMIGCVAVLMEEDDTRHEDIVLGRIAFTKEMEKQLNDLMRKRIQTNNDAPLTDAEKDTIKNAVSSKVKAAIASRQGLFDIFTDHDDALGFTHVILPEGSGGTISTRAFDFPEIVTKKKGLISERVTDRFVLSGELTVGRVPSPPLDLCSRPRAALKAKQDEINSLHIRVQSLQQMLHTATPQQKPAIIQQIIATNELTSQAEAELPALQAALKACMDRFLNTHIDIDEDGGILRD